MHGQNHIKNEKVGSVYENYEGVRSGCMHIGTRPFRTALKTVEGKGKWEVDRLLKDWRDLQG